MSYFLRMPAGSHAVTGLMQHVIDPNLIAHNRLSFHSEEAALIRAALSSRVDLRRRRER
jgi:hypothetical protein